MTKVVLVIGSRGMYKAVSYLFGFVRARKGAPDFNFALGYCDRYVIIDISSIFGFTISSGLMSCNKNDVIREMTLLSCRINFYLIFSLIFAIVIVINIL